MIIWFKGREFDTDDIYNYEYYICPGACWGFYIRVDRIKNELKNFDCNMQLKKDSTRSISSFSEKCIDDHEWWSVDLDVAIKYAKSLL